jgi:hypothetical protein
MTDEAREEAFMADAMAETPMETMELTMTDSTGRKAIHVKVSASTHEAVQKLFDEEYERQVKFLPPELRAAIGESVDAEASQP